jgi:hypothetical protein
MSIFWDDNKDEPHVFRIIAVIVLALILIITLGMWGCPQYNVWERHMTGKAALARAEQDRQIKVHEAKAAAESAILLAEAEVERAKGVAQANEIISMTITEPYLRYLFLQGLHDGNSEVIYVPTEANMPILEAGRLGQREGSK